MKKVHPSSCLFRHSAGTCILAVAFVLLLAVSAQGRSGGAGLNFGVGLGAHIPVEDEAYGDLGADFYPEFQVMGDYSGFRFGISAGFVYREVELWEYTGRRSRYEEFEMSFVPLKFNVAVMPFRFTQSRLVFQPYVGLGAGAYLATGDNDEDLALFSVNGGFELRFTDWYNLSFDVAYNNVGDADEYYDSDYFNLGGRDLSYVTVMVVNRFRIPFSRRNL